MATTTKSGAPVEQLRLAQRANAYARCAVDDIVRLILGHPDKAVVLAEFADEIRTQVARAFVVGYTVGLEAALLPPHRRSR